MSDSITFDEVHAANVARRKRWHPSFLTEEQDWTGADWSNAMCGEAGEAANVVKKLRRQDSGSRGSIDPDRDRLVGMLADEIGDVYAYLDLLATYYGIDIGKAIVHKFNKISEREGFPDRIRPDPNRHTWDTVPVGHDVPGSGTVIKKTAHGEFGWHITFHRTNPFQEDWVRFYTGKEKVPTELTPTGLRYWQ